MILFELEEKQALIDHIVFRIEGIDMDEGYLRFTLFKVPEEIHSDMFAAQIHEDNIEYKYMNTSGLAKLVAMHHFEETNGSEGIQIILKPLA